MTRSRFRRLRWICIALAVIGLGYVLVDPTSSSILLGVLHGESFYQGKPTNYWGRLIKERDEAGFQAFQALSPQSAPHPFPWNWIYKLVRPPSRRQHTEVDNLLQPLLRGDPAAVSVLIELLDQEDAEVRATATDGLRAVGPAARDATLALARGLSDCDHVQEKSFQALAALGPSAEAAVPALKAIIRAGPGQGPAFVGYAAVDSYNAKWPRIAAATVLLRISPEDEEILPTLLHALNDREEPDERMHEPDWRVRTAAIQALGDVGPRARVAVPKLLEIIETDDNGYRVEVAAEALKKIDSEAAIKAGVK